MLNRAHHAPVEMLHYVTVKWHDSHDIWIPEIHTDGKTRILP